MSLAAQIISELRQTATGAAILDDWLGAGGQPVPQSHADARAAKCVVCPLNVAPGWWHLHFVDKIAKAIRRHLEVKNSIGLDTPHDLNLSMCKVCGCCNRLAVWVPIKHIALHTDDEKLNKFPEPCWKKHEIIESLTP